MPGIRADVEFRIDHREKAAGNARSLGYPIPPISTIRLNQKILEEFGKVNKFACRINRRPPQITGKEFDGAENK